MKPTSSPWLLQLHAERPSFGIGQDTKADVIIIGAGIAGVSTAFFVLQQTSARVLLLDAGRVAHGATGHNAGQVVSYFERPFSSMVNQFGLSAAAHAVDSIESAWDLLQGIQRAAALRTPLHLCTGHAGLSTLEQILEHLENNRLRSEAGLKYEPLLVRIDETLRKEIPRVYDPFIAEMPHSQILKMLQTEDSSFIAALTSPKACMNSAQFCEELLGHMIATYGDRMSVAEHLPVHTISAEKGKVRLETGNIELHAAHVVLCTNGFENITLRNMHGPEIDAKFHRRVQGLIGYMAGYEEPGKPEPSAISYFSSKNTPGEPYYYLTQRPFTKPRGGESRLLCLGGPERLLPDKAPYDRESSFPADVEEEMDRTMRRLRAEGPERRFLWHGLMGYTPSGLRCIGHEPANPRILYNLGCNGVGILPSLYGGKRIAQLLSGVHLPPSLFDPQSADMLQK